MTDADLVRFMLKTYVPDSTETVVRERLYLKRKLEASTTCPAD